MAAEILHVVGTRPNFMKVAPVIEALQKKNGFVQRLIHTGQHYDINMSHVFFEELGLPLPDASLEVGSGSHAVQTAQIMIRFEQALLQQRPDLVLVYGDVNSTVAAALVCAKLGIPVGHVEAGLRSFDRTMPEELNRLITDQISDLLFTPSADGNENLRKEGVDGERVHLVGNVMIDTLVRSLPEALKRWPALQLSLGLHEKRYGLITLHRPSNVDDLATLSAMVAAVEEISETLPIVFPVHPRTRQRIGSLDVNRTDARVSYTEPLGYLDFLALQYHAALVMTDSGGMQEETTYLNVPCLTIRENTERPVTLTMGTNDLVGTNMALLKERALRICSGQTKHGRVPPLWDGHASERIADVVKAYAEQG